MTVHELARRVRIAPHVVRFYTQRGLLQPQRNARNDYREYAESDVYRLRFICRAKLVGFTLSDIKLILADAAFASTTRARQGDGVTPTEGQGKMSPWHNRPS